MLHWIKSLDRVLKGESTQPESLRSGTIELPVFGLGVLIVLLAAVYGACMGSFNLMAKWDTPARFEGYQQMLASAAKVPMLFVLSLLITFPSLYVVNALVGSRLAFASVSRLMIAALGVIMAVLASFGTITVFFSLCTTSYSFMVLLNVAIFAVAGLFGMRFLMQTLHRLSIAMVVAQLDESADAVGPPAAAADFGQNAPPPLPSPAAPRSNPGALDRIDGQIFGPQVRKVFRVWVLVFGLVGSQMGWVLSPFIGNPTLPYTFFHERRGSFFEAVFDHIAELAGGEGKWGKKSHHSRDGRRGEDTDTDESPKRPATRPTSAQ